MQISYIRQRIQSRPLIWKGFLVLLGSWLIAAGANIEVPMIPVPMTMQSLAVLVIGSAMSFRMASLAVSAYLVQGAAGLPVFAGGAGGIHHLAGPTGGYLFGFLAAASVMSYLNGRMSGRGCLHGNLKLTGLLFTGTFILFACGLAWLSMYTGFEKALTAGLYPFIPGLILKIILAFCVVKIIGRHF